MNSADWITVPLSSLCSGIYDGPHATPKKAEKGPIYLGISNLSKGRLDLTEVEHLSNEDFIKWTRRVLPEENDIVFSYETRLGEAALIPKGLQCCLGRRMGLLRVNPNKADPTFMLYAFLGPEFQTTIRERTIHGSTVDRIPLIDLPTFPISLPNLSLQRAIVLILYPLDEKIRLNQQINKTLEDLGQAIFKRWFVDFEFPNQEGKPYESSGGEMVESELGLIPLNWEIKELGDIVRIANKTINPQKNPNKFFRYFSIPAFDEDKVPVWCSGQEIKSIKFLINNDSVLVSKLNPETSRIWLPFVEESNESISSTEFIVYLPKKDLSRYFIYLILKSSRFSEFLLSLVTGSTGSRQRVHPNDTLRYKLAIPTESYVIERLSEIAKSLSLKQELNLRQNVSLSGIRDNLLPKLMSGKIRVPMDNKMEIS